MFLRNIFEAIQRTGQGKTAVVGWGRGMGHKGHMMLASSVITQAGKVGGDPYFVVSKTVGKDDPITPDEKIAIYKKVFPQSGNIFQPATDEIPDLTRVLANLNQQGYTSVTVVLGADQVKAFQYLKNYNNKPDKSGNILYSFDNLDVISRQETGDPSAGEEGPRATPMRQVLMDPTKSEQEQFQVWRDAMNPEISDDEVRDLMMKAKQRMTAMNAPKPKKVKAAENLDRVAKDLTNPSGREAQKYANFDKSRDQRRSKMEKGAQDARNNRQYPSSKDEWGNLKELSSEKLGQYKKAAGAQASAADKVGDTKKADKRFSGIVKATKKQFANDEKGVAEARRNPEQNRRSGSGKYDLINYAEDINDKDNWAVSMTMEPKLGINPQAAVSEDTPKGIYFYPLQYFMKMADRDESLPWGDNFPYIQLFQYDRSGEMTQQTKVDPARLKQALLQYCPEEVIQSAIDEPEYDGTPYWFIYDCLSRLGQNDETIVVRWNKILRDLGFTSVYDPGRGWIAYNEPTQGVILDPRIIKQHKMFSNRNPTLQSSRYDLQSLADAIGYSSYYQRESQLQRVQINHPDEKKVMLDVAKSMLKQFLGKSSEEAKASGYDQAIKAAADKVIEILKQPVTEGKKKKSRSKDKLSKYFFPGYGYYGYGGTNDSGEGGDGGGESVAEKWSKKYKSSINCSNPKGFSQKAHCAGKNEGVAVEPDPKGYQKDLLSTPKNSLVIDTPGDLDWYKLGQHYPTLGTDDPHEYGQGDSDMMIVPYSKQELVDLKQKLDRLKMRYKEIGGSPEQPEIHDKVEEKMLPKSAFAGSNKNKLGTAAHLKGSMKRSAKAGDLVGGAEESKQIPVSEGVENIIDALINKIIFNEAIQNNRK